MSICHPIAEIWLFEKLTMKIQCHGWGQMSKPHSGPNNISIHIPFVPCQLAIPSLGYGYFKIWHWKSKVKIIAQGHKVAPTPIDSHPFRSITVVHPIPWIRILQHLILKIQGQRNSSIKVTSYRLTSLSFYVKRPIIPKIRLFEHLTFKIQGLGNAGLIIDLRPANEKRRYCVTTYLIAWAQT